MNDDETRLREALGESRVIDRDTTRLGLLNAALAAARAEGRAAGLKEAAALVQIQELSDGSPMPGRDWCAKIIRAKTATSNEAGKVESGDDVPCMGCRGETATHSMRCHARRIVEP